MVSFETTQEESEIIKKIVKRAKSLNHRVDDCVLSLDISAVHANGCPLYLEGLLEADYLDFIRDVFGIMQHIDRETGQLDGFLPHFAA